jgi:cytochrome c oxidase assembly factor CtaG
VERPFDIALLTEQQPGGLVWWLPGDMMSILAAGIEMSMWYLQEREKQGVEEAQSQG